MTLPNTTEYMWWGYLHANGTVQVKRWFGDHQDYTTDCENNAFVRQVIVPFEAATREEALDILCQRLNCVPTHPPQQDD